MAFIVVQHLPPDRQSLIAEILSRHTQMPVQQIEDGMAVQANNVYIIRPGRTLAIRNGHLHFGEPVEKPGFRRPVDHFFRSLAEEQRERAVCICMSGMGSDGTAGAQLVKAVGGLCIAQDPDSAKQPPMPRAMIDAGLADFVLRPEHIPDVLLRYASHPYARDRLAHQPILSRESQALNEILTILRTRTRQEFNGYKKPTVIRRIQRRMSLHQAMQMDDYVKVLRNTPHEATALADDIVIHITGFFRDPQAWEALQKQVIELLVSFETIPEHSVERDGHGTATDESNRESIADHQRVRDELQTAVEELQTSNEELKASNEEVTSVNEELQSTNEEMETSKEELQSLNEELTTVNAQLQAKMEELEGMTNDLSSLLSSTDIAVIFLDRNFRIRRFTPAVRNLLDLLGADIGRPLSDLAQKFTDPNLMTDAASVLDKLIPIEREITSDSGVWYMRRILPYRTTDNRIEGVVITFVDISQRRTAETNARESEEHYKLIVQGVREYAIFMLDPQGIITVWNIGAERVLGFTEREAIGQNARFIFTPEDQDACEPEMELTRAAGTGHSLDERWHVRRGGERFWGNGIVTAVRRPDGTLRAFVKVMRDNTDRKISEQNLEEARKAAVAASESKDQFLAIVSHELRTPLSVVLLWAKMLNAGKMPEAELRAGLAAIESSAEAQKQLIEDLLDNARISSGKLRLNMRETDICQVIRSSVETMKSTADAKSVKIIEDYGDDLGVVLADPERLQQIAWNIITNAVKFTPQNGLVTVGLWRRKNGVELRITDNGIGIPKDFVPQVFERFKQAEGVHTRSHGGLGLGLNIAKQLVELHGGTIEATSEGLNKGAVFTVRLPLSRLKKGKGAARGAKIKSDYPLADVPVLLVEDNAETCQAVATLLSGAGAKVTAVYSAALALQAYPKVRPQLIVSDIGMPEMDGFTFIEKVRELEVDTKSPRVPAIALSAFTRDEDRTKASQSGFDDHLAKPVDTDMLISTLSALLKAE